MRSKEEEAYRGRAWAGKGYTREAEEYKGGRGRQAGGRAEALGAENKIDYNTLKHRVHTTEHS
jgi:hypothetical protein